MPIRFACTHCKKSLAVSDDRAGAKVACPGCKSTLHIPTASSPALPPPAASTTSPHSSLDTWDQVDGVLGGVVEVVDRRLTDREEAKVRASFTDYADAIPHHDIRGLGKQVTVTRVREFRSHHVVLDSLYEKRHAARKEEPFAGTGVPPAVTTAENIRVWDYSYPTPGEYQKATVEQPVEDSRHISACGTCGGRASVACPTCSAAGAVACAKCSGSGVLACRQCSGHGMVQQVVRTEQRQRHCSNCTGGRVKRNYSGMSDENAVIEVCGWCNGTAVVFDNTPVYENVRCPACDRGQVRCTNCGGAGRVRCSQCTGGKIACAACKATGKLVVYLAVVRTFEPGTQTIPVPCSALKNAAIVNIIQSADYSPLLTLVTTSHPAVLKLTSGFEKLRNGVTKAFGTALAQSSGENRLVRQRLQVGAASVLEVAYNYDGHDYTAWFVGKQMRVYAPVSPVTDALKQMVKDAVRGWKKGESKAATLRLRKVMDMAAADPCCRAAYDEVRDTIPADLESKAKWVKWKPYIIAGALVAGLFLLVGVIGIVYAITKAKNRPSPPGAFDPRGGAAAPAGYENTVLVQFRQRLASVPKGGTVTLRLTVTRLGPDRDVTVRLEAGRGLTVPVRVVVGRGQEEIEVEVRAGDEAGMFVVKAAVEPENAASPPAECRVSVGNGPGGGVPPFPR